MSMEMELREALREAKAAVDNAIKRQKLKMVLELCGFGYCTVGIGLALQGDAIWWKFLLGALSGWMMGAFAWRFVSSFWEMIFTYIVAAQKGTVIALSLQKEGLEGLDKWDCGDPSCEGCSKRRGEKNA